MATVVGSKPLNGKAVEKQPETLPVCKSLSGFLSAVAAGNRNTIEKVYGSGYKTRQVEKTALGNTSGAIGGYLLPVEYSTEMLRRMVDMSIIKQRAMVIPMGSAETQCPKVDIETATGTAGVTSLFGGFQATWGNQEVPLESEPGFRKNVLYAWDLIAYGKVSNQWLEDVGPQANEYLYTILAGACNWQCEFAYLQGIGAAQTMPLGILNAPATIQVHRHTSSHISNQDPAAMVAALLPYSMINAVWMCSPLAYGDIGQLSLFNINRPSLPEFEGSAGSLMGKPLFITDKLPALGTLGDLVLFDPSLYVVGERQEVLVDKSSVGAGFVTNQTYFRVWYRGDGKPMVQTSVTLQDNSTVVSPYVALL